MAFRLVQSVEKELIADSTNMDEEAQKNLSRLHPGEAYIYYSLLEAPQLVMTKDVFEMDGLHLNVSDNEVAEKCTYWESHLKQLCPYKECAYGESCNETCDFNLRSNAEYIANSAFSIYRHKIKTNEDLRKCIYNLPLLMKKEFDKFSNMDIKKLHICSRIKTMRKIMLELPVSITEKETKRIISEFPNDGKGVED